MFLGEPQESVGKPPVLFQSDFLLHVWKWLESSGVQYGAELSSLPISITRDAGALSCRLASLLSMHCAILDPDFILGAKSDTKAIILHVCV